jgi:hypothetical protein
MPERPLPAVVPDGIDGAELPAELSAELLAGEPDHDELRDRYGRVADDLPSQSA